MFMVQTLISLINLGQQDFSKGLQVPIGTHRELSFSNGAGASTKITTKVSSFQLVWSGSLLLTISGRSYHVKGTCKFRLCSPFMYHNQFGSIHRTVYKYIWWNRWPYETWKWPEEDKEKATVLTEKFTSELEWASTPTFYRIFFPQYRILLLFGCNNMILVWSWRDYTGLSWVGFVTFQVALLGWLEGEESAGLLIALIFSRLA